MDIQKLFEEYMKQANVMQLATERNGQPWVSTVWAAYDQERHSVYWLSRRSSRHSKELGQNQRVAGAVVLPHDPNNSERQGFQMEGDASECFGDDLERAYKVYAAKFDTSKDYLEKAKQQGEDVTTWYALKLRKIVTFDTIHFADDPRQELILGPIAAKPKPTIHSTSAKLYADGGSRGNPGPSAGGFVIFNDEGTVLLESGKYLGITTNNQAEYHSLKGGIEAAIKLGIRELEVYMDSLLVVNQMKGIYKIRNRDLWPIHEAIKQSLVQFKKVTFTHIPRELNKHADGLVNQILDSEANK